MLEENSTTLNKWPADEVKRWPIERLVPYARNARTHSDEQIAQVAASIQEWGWTNPVLVGEDGGIIAGHCRVLAGRQLGLAEVPVMLATGWSEAQKRAYVLADNQLALNAGWNPELLRLELGELKELDFDLGLIGFDDAQLAALTVNPGLTDPDEVPEPPSVPVAQPGEVWQLGRHRLMCGDCRDPAVIVRLVDGTKINLAFTSPPYAEQREYDASSGFQLIPPDAYVDWFKPVAANVAQHLAADGSWFINIKPASAGLDTELYVMDLVLAHVRAWGWHFATEFCWERGGVPKSVTQRFKNQFEPIYQFALGRWKMRPNAVRHESENVPRAGGEGVGNTSWANNQGGNGAFFGAAKRYGPTISSIQGVPGAKNDPLGIKKRRNGTSQLMSDAQGQNAAPGEYIGPGLAYPGNRLPTFTSSHDATGHTAAFPVGLPKFFCDAFTDADDVVFDPFLGSGSTLIAAAQTNRVGIGCEISPAYCDVTIERWQNFTGEKAKRLEAV